MLYILELGQVEQTIARQAYRSNQPLPERIANAPQLRLGLALYMNAFFDLDTERSLGMSPGCIPWTSVKDYSLAYEFDDYQTESLFYIIKAMDKAHLKKIADDIESKGKK